MSDNIDKKCDPKTTESESNANVNLHNTNAIRYEALLEEILNEKKMVNK